MGGKVKISRYHVITGAIREINEEIKINWHKRRIKFPLKSDCKNKVLTAPSVLSAWPCDVPAPPLSFFFFFSSSRCSFCRFCTSMSAEMKLFFTSFSKSSSSLRASCCTSSSENLRMFVSVSSRRSFSSATLRVLTPAEKNTKRTESHKAHTNRNELESIIYLSYSVHYKVPSVSEKTIWKNNNLII